MNKVTFWLFTIFLVGALEVTEAQQPAKVPRMAFISGQRACRSSGRGFTQGLRDRGYIGSRTSHLSFGTPKVKTNGLQYRH